jgi:oligoendopeptidase F
MNMAYTIKKWDLTQLYPGFDSPELQGAFDNVEEQVASFEGVRGKLNPDMDVIPFRCGACSESIARCEQMYSYAGLAFAEDAKSKCADSDRAHAIRAEMQNRIVLQLGGRKWTRRTPNV